MATSGGRVAADYHEATRLNEYNYLMRHIEALGYGYNDRAIVDSILDHSSGENYANAFGALQRYGMATSRKFLSQAQLGWRSFYNGDESGFASVGQAYGMASASNVRRKLRIWADVNGYHARADHMTSHTSKMTGWDLALGLDQVNCDWLYGFGFQYGDGRIKTSAVASSHNADSYTFGLYGGRRFRYGSGTLYLTAGLNSGFHSIEGRRGDGLGGSYSADFDIWSLGSYLDAGYAIQPAKWFEIQPFTTLAWNGLWNKSFSESGGNGIYSQPHHVGADNHHTVSSALGVRVKYDAGRLFGIDASVGWQHLFGSIRPEARIASGNIGSSYTIKGNALSRDEAVVSAGLTIRPTVNIAIRAGYDGAFGTASRDHRGSVKFMVQF
ncbi:MAG: autotransporter outer membrane beta-barrel domain-containing protein [Planctomycetes bacterium]|nr:autotransporter outer membrane beta-barrel domain-containing protein [Planctomycetota bacterium]